MMHGRVAYCVTHLQQCGRTRMIMEHTAMLALQQNDVKIFVDQMPEQRELAWFNGREGGFFIPIFRRDQLSGCPRPFDAVVACDGDSVGWSNELSPEGSRHFRLVYEIEGMMTATTEKETERFLRGPTYPLFHPIVTASWMESQMPIYPGWQVTVIRNGADPRKFYRTLPRSQVPRVIVLGTDPIGMQAAEYLWKRYDARLSVISAASDESVPAAIAQHGWLAAYYYKPTLRERRDLYSDAWFMIVAKKFTGSTVEILEAMTIGTPTALATTLGDDNVIHNKNGLRSAYSYAGLECSVKSLCGNREVRDRITHGAVLHGAGLVWDAPLDTLARLYFS